MGKIISKARLTRMRYGLKVGRMVTAKEVADSIGVTEATLSRIERGHTERIDFDTLRKLCAFYGVGVGEILEYTEDEQRALESEQGNAASETPSDSSAHNVQAALPVS